MRLAVGDALLPALELAQAPLQLALLGRQPLLRARGFDLPRLDVALDLLSQPDGFLLRLQLRLATERIGLPRASWISSCRVRLAAASREPPLSARAATVSPPPATSPTRMPITIPMPAPSVGCPTASAAEPIRRRAGAGASRESLH